MTKTFLLKGKAKPQYNALNYDKTLHHYYRQERLKVIQSLGPLEEYASFVVDTNHIDGWELHTVCKNGVIVIGNINKKEVITYLIARPAQIRRYGIEDEELLRIAYEHNVQQLNMR